MSESIDGMDTTSKALLYLLVGIAAFFGAIILFSLGPLGWLVGGLIIVAWLVRGSSSNSDTTTPDKTNCPECGARNSTDRSDCEYCDAPLS
ncbi:zinc ribbon domain-containing protein [Halorussus halophilus]|uniref:zinc ribbon domain-containing protein n=1 Tax=Halorussus halophilus TaxID=2650975 RepID=UPI0013018835|nr:zinc ribbon domain-containing protein [Halorussus halophilus]